MNAAADAPLLDLQGLSIRGCRPIHLLIAPGDRFLVLGSDVAQVPKQRLVDLLLAESEIGANLLEDTAGYIVRAADIADHVQHIKPAPAGSKLREHAGSIVGRAPSNTEMRSMLDILGLGQWFADAERLYPGVSLDCDFSLLPPTFPAEATLLKVWAPVILQHMQRDFNEQKFYVLGPDAFSSMGEQLIATTLGKLKAGTGWLRVAADEAGELLEDGIVHSARCGRGSRRLDEAVVVFYRDRVLSNRAKRSEDLRA